MKRHRGEGGKKKRLEVAYRPFLRLSSGDVMLCDALVLSSNVGRSISNLLDVRRPEDYTRIQNQRSRWYIARLQPRLAARRLTSKVSVPLPDGAGGGDIDLLVIDEANRMLLACEVTSLRDIYTEGEAQTAITQLQKGMTQARRSLEWLRASPASVTSLLGPAAAYEPFAMVLSESYLPLDRIDDDTVPLINDRVPDGVLQHPSYRSLRTLYEVARQGAIFPGHGFNRLVDRDPVEFCGFRFPSEVPSAEPLRSWDPNTDIDFSGLG